MFVFEECILDHPASLLLNSRLSINNIIGRSWTPQSFRWRQGTWPEIDKYAHDSACISSWK